MNEIVKTTVIPQKSGMTNVSGIQRTPVSVRHGIHKKTRTLAALTTALLLFCLCFPLTQGVFAASEPRELPLPVEQKFNYSSGSPNETFTYRLTPVGGAPMPAGSANEYSFAISGKDKIYDLVIPFASASDGGPYKYELKCVTEGSEAGSTGYTVDKQVYIVKVWIVNSVPLATAFKKAANENNANEKTEILFTHSYTPPTSGGDPYIPPKEDTPKVDPPPPEDEDDPPETTKPPETPDTPTVPGTTEPSGPGPGAPPAAPGPETPEETPEPAETEEPAGISERPDPPAPSRPGGSLVPSGNGGYIEFDENGVALGEWHYDEDLGEWIFEEYPPPLADAPELLSPVSPWMLVLVILGIIMFIIGWLIRRRNRDEEALEGAVPE
jgi:hypothetical protein